jgi:hypothetical protein
VAMATVSWRVATQNYGTPEREPVADVTRFALAQRVDPTADRRHMLAEVQIQALDKRGVDRPAPLGQYLVDRLTRAEHHAVLDPHDASTPVRLHDLGIE